MICYNLSNNCQKKNYEYVFRNVEIIPMDAIFSIVEDYRVVEAVHQDGFGNQYITKNLILAEFFQVCGQSHEFFLIVKDSN